MSQGSGPVILPADEGLSAVGATGDSIDECAAEMRDAITFHIEGLQNAGEPAPPSTSRGRTVEVAA